MNIEKVKNYNQKLLAIIGTIAAILLLVALIALIAEIIRDYRWSNNHDVETGILSDEKIEKLQKENKREQVISYETPKLVDTLNSIYIIPVSHKNLNDAEDINGLLSIKDSFKRNYESDDSRYSRQYYGAYNNLIIYNQQNNLINKLFHQRVNFNNIDTTYFTDEIILLFKIAEKDTYKDGVINLRDFKSLYIYSFNKSKTQKIGIDGMDVYNYEFINNSKDLVIEFGIDKNNDGQYQEYNEPTIIKKYDFESGKLTDIIDKKTNSDLQKTLEGTEK